MTERPRLTVGAMLFKKDKEKILLLKSQKWNGRYIFPCGHVEFGETLETALKREVREETGLEIKDIRFLKVLEFIKSSEYNDNSLHFVGLQYFCRESEGDLKINREAESYVWTSVSEALKLDLESGTRETIEDYLANK